MNEKILIDRSVAEQALQSMRLGVTMYPNGKTGARTIRAAIGALRTALEHPQVEQPVAWMNADRDMTYTFGPYHSDDIPLYEHPQPPRQPLPEDLRLAIESMIESHESGDLDGWEVQLVKRRLHEAINGIGGEK